MKARLDEICHCILFLGETGKSGEPGPQGLVGEVGLPGKIHV